MENSSCRSEASPSTTHHYHGNATSRLYYIPYVTFFIIGIVCGWTIGYFSLRDSLNDERSENNQLRDRLYDHVDTSRRH